MQRQILDDASIASKAADQSETGGVSSGDSKEERERLPQDQLKEIEKSLLLVLDDATIELPIDTTDLRKLVAKQSSARSVPAWAVEEFLQKFTALTAVRCGSGLKISGWTARCRSSEHHDFCIEF